MRNLLNKFIPFSFALWTMILLNCVVVVFHTFVLLKIIPYDIVWAGKLKSNEEMLVFESISILINILLMIVLLIKGDLLKTKLLIRFATVVLWMFVVIFALNTIGNLFSKTTTETFVATPLTFISAILCLRLVLNNEPMYKV